MNFIMENTLAEYLSYPFVIHALIVGTLVAVCSSLMGVTLILKRFSFIGDGLAHVAFGGVAIASVLNLADKMPLVMLVTTACAVLLLRGGQHAEIKGDAAIAMLSVGALAVGYLLMNIFATTPNLTADVCSTLFGSTSILTLSSKDVWFSAILSLVIILWFLMFYHKIFAVTFDEDFAKAVGAKVELYNFLIALVIAAIIVISMKLIGSLLIAAFIVFPALSAMRIFRSFAAVTVAAGILSGVSAFGGIIISILAGTPVGATIVTVNIAVFLLCKAIGSGLGN